MIDFLKSLNEHSIPYVSWKNNHDLARVLAGESDLDIFVPAWHAADFRQLARDALWVAVENPVARYPDIFHYYYVSASGIVYHLHVYFRVVTGDSWLKEYVLPLDKWLIASREWSEDWSIWVLKKEAQGYLFALRHLVKNGSISGRLLYHKNLSMYQSEWAQCSFPSLESEPDNFPSLQPFIAGSRLESDRLRISSWYSSVRLRYSLSPFLRLSLLSLPLRRASHFLRRALNKLVIREKKVFAGPGLIIAIAGADGSGKTTLKKEVVAAFGAFMTVRGASLGKPQPEWLTRLNGAASKPYYTSEKERPQALNKSLKESTGTLDAFKGLVLGLMRLHAARGAFRKAQRGYLVISDRWPTAQEGFMDGPRLCPPDAGKLMQLLSTLEKGLYSRIPRADLCLYVRVPEAEAVSRNAARSKHDKESDDEIRTRHQASFDHRPLAINIVNFDNNGPLAVKRAELISTLWKEISDRYG
jgi:thymidylate kinase